MTTTAERRPEETDRIIKEWTRLVDRHRGSFMSTRERAAKILSWIRVTEGAVDIAREEIKTKEKEAKEADEEILGLWKRVADGEWQIQLLADRLKNQGETITRYQKKVKELETERFSGTKVFNFNPDVDEVVLSEEEIRYLKAKAAEELHHIDQKAKAIRYTVNRFRRAIVDRPADDDEGNQEEARD